MNRYWSGLVIAGIAAATVSLGAQNPQNPANTPPRDAAAPPGVQRAPEPPSAQPRTPNTVTISGCIQNAPTASAAAGAGAADRPGAGAGAADKPGAAATTRGTTGQSFVLANGRMTAGGTAGAAVGTTGTTASYQLEGNTEAVSQHLNHQVEITGTVQTSSASPTGAGRAAPGSTSAAPTLRVESVKMVSATCAPAMPAAQPSQTQPRGQTPSQPPSQPREQTPARPEPPQK
jgi:hypothetical protein